MPVPLCESNQPLRPDRHMGGAWRQVHMVTAS